MMHLILVYQEFFFFLLHLKTFKSTGNLLVPMQKIILPELTICDMGPTFKKISKKRKQ